MSVVDRINERYLWCRDVMHSWDAYQAKVSQNKTSRRREMHQVLICARCGTLKTRVMTLSGELLRSSYSYANGYLLKDQGRLSPADRSMIRAINLKQAVYQQATSSVRATS